MPTYALDNTLGKLNSQDNAPKTLEELPFKEKAPEEAPEPKTTLEQHWEQWRSNPKPATTAVLLDRLSPVIEKAVTSYGGGNPALRSRAKLLAINAIQVYDPKHGTKLQTHVMNQLQPLMRYSKDYGSLTHVPERIYGDLHNLRQSHQELSEKLGREPSEQEMADKTGLSMRRLSHIRKYSKGEISESGMSTQEDGDSETFYPGVQTNDPQKIWMEYVHHDLDPVGQKILEMKTGFNGQKVLSTNEIARILKMSPSAVSQRAKKIADTVAKGQGVM